MRALLLTLLLMLAGCVEAHPTDFAPYTLRLDFENGVCSGTAVGPNIILTAQHCFDGAGRLTAINGEPAYALKLIKDGKDHALVRVSAKFKRWAQVGNYPVTGDRVRWLGNPAGEANVYREGYVARSLTDELLIDAPGFGGDSGSGIFNSRGQLVAVLSAGKTWQARNGMRFDLILAWPMAFTAQDWREIR